MASSYLQKFNPQVLNKQPLKLNNQALLQEFASKLGYWQQGVAKIQQSYQNVLQLDPQFGQNKEYMKRYIDDATKQMQKYVSSDLSIQDNAAQASKLFNGILDPSKKENELLLIDHSLNQYYKTQIQDSDKARLAVNKKGEQGENWNLKNDFYFRNEYNKYLEAAKEGDISQLNSLYQNKKGFIPYYDDTQDINDAIKNCKSSSSVTQAPASNPLYLEKSSYKGITAEQLQGCLSFLPERAKQQIGINSYYDYYNNKEGLLEDYKYLVKDKYEEQEKTLKAEIAALEIDPNKNKDILINKKAELETLSAQVIENTKDWEKLVGNNGIEFINKNYERIASITGFQKKISALGKAHAYSDVERIFSPNAAQIAMDKLNADIWQTKFVQGNLNNRQTQNLIFQAAENQNEFNREVQLQFLKGEIQKGVNEHKSKLEGTDGGSGVFGHNSPIPLGITEQHNFGDNDTNWREQNIQELITASQATEGTRQTLKKLIATQLGKDASKITDGELATFIDNYESKTEKKDPIIETSLSAYYKARTNEANKRELLLQADNKAKEIKQKSINSFSDKKAETGLTNSNGQKILLSDREIASALQGETITLASGNKLIIKQKGLGNLYDEELKRLGGTNISGFNKAINAGLSAFGTYMSSSDDFEATLVKPDGTTEKLTLGRKKIGDSPILTKRINTLNIGTKNQDLQKDLNSLYQNQMMSIKGFVNPNFSTKTQEEVNKRAATILGLSENPNYKISVDIQDGEGNALARVLEKSGDGWQYADINKLDILKRNPNITLTGISDSKKAEYVQIPGLLKSLSGYVSAVELMPLKAFTENVMRSLKSGESSSKFSVGQYYETISKNKKIPIKIAVTNINDMPIFEIYGYYDNQDGSGKTWQKADFEKPITSEADVLRIINTEL